MKASAFFVVSVFPAPLSPLIKMDWFFPLEQSERKALAATPYTCGSSSQDGLFMT